MSSLIIPDAVDLLPGRRGPGHSYDGNAVRFAPLIYLAAPITVYGTRPYNSALAYLSPAEFERRALHQTIAA